MSGKRHLISERTSNHTNIESDTQYGFTGLLELYPLSGRGVRPRYIRPASLFPGESVVPELHGPAVLLPAASHLLFSGESLPHDAAGEAPSVFHLEVHLTHTPHTDVAAAPHVPLNYETKNMATKLCE